jgi:hypothetical protein
MKSIPITLSMIFVLSGCSLISINTSSPEPATENADTVSSVEENEEAVSDTEENKETLSTTENEEAMPTDADKQDVIIAFIQEDIHKISELETVAFNSLVSVSGENYTDDPTMLAVIKQDVLPAYKEAVSEAEKLEAPIPELEQPTEQIKMTTKAFLESVELQKEALEKQDIQVMEEANQKMLEYQGMLEEYHGMMKVIADEYEITYEPLQIDQTDTL